MTRVPYGEREALIRQRSSKWAGKASPNSPTPKPAADPYYPHGLIATNLPRKSAANLEWFGGRKSHWHADLKLRAGRPVMIVSANPLDYQAGIAAALELGYDRLLVCGVSTSGLELYARLEKTK